MIVTRDAIFPDSSPGPNAMFVLRLSSGPSREKPMAVTWKMCPTTALFPLSGLNTEELQTLFSFYKLNTLRGIISTVGQQS